MSLPYPRVRDACESCHRRKIRCLLQSGSPACQSCLSSGDSCLFAPRAKAGRPRRTHSEKIQRRHLSSLSADNLCARTTSQIRHVDPHADAMIMVAADELQFDAFMAFDDHWDPEKMAEIKGLGNVEFVEHTSIPTKGDGNIMDMQEMGEADFHGQHSTPKEAYEASILLNEVQNLPPQEERNNQMPTQRQQDRTNHSIEMPTASHSATPALHDTLASVTESLDFDAALKLCGDLDRSYCTLRDRKVDAFGVKGIMKMVEYACAMAASSSSIEKASTALLLAAVYKVLEVCETLARQIGDGSLSADIWECSFQLQKLDLALFQALHFLKRVNQLEALKKTSELHTCIQSILQQEQYQSIW